MKHLHSLSELDDCARQFIQSLTPLPDRATLVTLSGELGAGKTAFTKAVAKALGVREVVNSPTFVLEKIYELPVGNAFRRLVHIDAYRLESGTELAPLGFSDLLRDSGNLIMLEWPEKIAEALPKPAVSITLTGATNGVHTIDINHG